MLYHVISCCCIKLSVIIIIIIYLICQIDWVAPKRIACLRVLPTTQIQNKTDTYRIIYMTDTTKQLLLYVAIMYAFVFVSSIFVIVLYVCYHCIIVVLYWALLKTSLLTDAVFPLNPRSLQLFWIMSMALGISRNHCWNQQITARFLNQES